MIGVLAASALESVFFGAGAFEESAGGAARSSRSTLLIAVPPACEIESPVPPELFADRAAPEAVDGAGPGKPMASLPPACRQVLAAPDSHPQGAALDDGGAAH